MLRNTPFLVFGVALAGCGGDSLTGAALFQQENPAAIENILAISEATTKISSAAALPETGTSTYNADIIILAEEPGNLEGISISLVGDMTITVTFDSSEPINGYATGFIDQNGQSVTGMLDIENSSMDSSAVFTADLDGLLNSQTAGVVAVDTNITGAFDADSGNEVVAVTGIVEGDITISGVDHETVGIFGGYETN